jgi:hypothetical protein
MEGEPIRFPRRVVLPREPQFDFPDECVTIGDKAMFCAQGSTPVLHTIAEAYRAAQKEDWTAARMLVSQARHYGQLLDEMLEALEIDVCQRDDVGELR